MSKYRQYISTFLCVQEVHTGTSVKCVVRAWTLPVRCTKHYNSVMFLGGIYPCALFSHIYICHHIPYVTCLPNNDPPRKPSVAAFGRDSITHTYTVYIYIYMQGGREKAAGHACHAYRSSYL